MASDKIHLKVITHEKIIYENDIDELYVKTNDEQLGKIIEEKLNSWLGKYGFKISALKLTPKQEKTMKM